MQWDLRCTFLRKPPAPVCLVFLLIALLLDRRVAASPGEIQLHRLVEQLELVDFLDGARSGLCVVEHDEGLSFRLEVLGRADVDDVAIFAEDFEERFLELGNLDALFKVLDLLEVLVGTRARRWQ